MKSKEIPELVLLPELPRYTDRLSFDSLALPVTFDERQLGIKLRTILKISDDGGFNKVRVTGEESEPVELNIPVNSLGPSGAASITTTGSRKRHALGKTEAVFPYPLTTIGDPDITIKLDLAEFDQRTRENKTEHAKGPLDASVRAKYLNAAVKSGLLQAAYLANIDSAKLADTRMYYGFMLSSVAFISSQELYLITHGFPEFAPMLTIQGIIAATTFGIAPSLQRFKHDRYIRRLGVDAESQLKMQRQVRETFFIGCSFDRYIKAAGRILLTDKLIETQAS